MVWFSLISFFVYPFFLVWVLAGWRKKTPQIRTGEGRMFISVIVPVRNEAENIEQLMACLEGQNYPAEKFEVIIVDDHSTDKTAEIVARHAVASGITIRLISSTGIDPERISPKKDAITVGIDAARGECIVLTDGDTRLQAAWLGTMNRHLISGNVKLLCGPVFMLPGSSFFSAIQSIEFASLTGTGAALFAWGYPAMCNGANLAFSKEVFREVKGYEGNEGIVSGDDEFLMKKIGKKYPGGIAYLKSGSATVFTLPSVRLQDFIQQRIRWAGKWRKHGLSTNMFLALFVFLIHSGILFGMVLAIMGYIKLIYLAGFLFIKLLLEYFLLRDIFVFAGKRMKLMPFFACSLLYSFYAVIFGILANTSTFSWKGRKFKH